MSIKRVLRVLTIATSVIAEATVGPVDMEKIEGALDILGMLEERLADCEEGGERSDLEHRLYQHR